MAPITTSLPAEMSHPELKSHESPSPTTTPPIPGRRESPSRDEADAPTQREVPRLYWERERLETFKDKWNVPFIPPKVMAAAGFYYTDHEDIVKCVFCGVSVGRWVAGDDPMADHKRWSPACRFVRNIDVGNIPMEEGLSEDSTNGYDTCGIYGITPTVKQGEAISVEKLGVQKSRPPSFANFATLDSRLKSFVSWPISLKLKPASLSEAGFYYTGKGDQTICFHCGGGLKDWEENDDPWVEHARWFSKCSFVLLVKGKDFVDEVCGRKFRKSNSDNTENCSTRRSSSTSDLAAAESSATKDSMETETGAEYSGANPLKSGASTAAAAANSLSDSRLCKICYTNEMGVLFLPCGHLVACTQCATSLTTCAVCRQPFTATVRAFLS